ncbi:MAG: putative integral rane protein [Actinomycetia bacterium]|nr:putative integral rane protein [Actinomycetes bacterium]
MKLMNITPAGSGRAKRLRLSPGAGRSRVAVRRTRVGGWWVALVAAALVLLLLLIFVLQNGQSVRISFLGVQGSLPLGVALLLAAVGGVLTVAIPGTGRIIQLRRLAHRPAEPSSPDPLTPSADQTKTVTQTDDEPSRPEGQVIPLRGSSR